MGLADRHDIQCLWAAAAGLHIDDRLAAGLGD